jgi:hypothetical protein
MQYVLQLNHPFFSLSNLDDMKIIINHIEPLKLAFKDVLVFSNAPIQTKRKECLSALVYFASCHSERTPALLRDLVRIPKSTPSTMRGLKHLEIQYQLLSCYKWLGQRFPETFCYLSEANEAQAAIREMIMACLETRK